MPVGSDPPRRMIAIAVAIPVVMALLVAWFGWTAKETRPRDLPVVVAGNPKATQALAAQLRQAQPGAFAITELPDAAAADAALRAHTAYAAIVIDTGISLHVASGASPALAEQLRQAVPTVGNRLELVVVDVVPTSPGDPHGGGFASGFLPLELASMLAGILLVLLVRKRAQRLVGLGLFAVLAGLAGAAVMQALDIITGKYLVTAAAIALLAVAVSAGVSGLGALLGPAGLALGVVVVFLLGNPISAVALVPEALPQPWGQIGQLLPAGSGVSLLRAVAFYDGADSMRPLLVLAGWAVAGVVLLLLGRAKVAASERSAGGA